MKPLRVGHLNFCNAIPFYRGLSNVQLVPGVPSELNTHLRQGKLDLSLVSSFEYLSNSSLYDLIPGYCIAAEGEVRSVHLHIKVPLKELNGQPLALTAQSGSSAQLVKIFCRYFWHIRPQFVTLPQLNDYMHYKAFLLIGDQALLHPGFPGYTRLDLAQVWKEKTDLPMTFALLSSTKGLMRKRRGEVLELSNQIDASLKWAEAHLKEVVDLAHKQTHIPQHLLTPYFPLLQYRLGKLQLAALNAFAALSDLPLPDQVRHLLNE